MSSSPLVHRNAQLHARQLLPRSWRCHPPAIHRASTPQQPSLPPQRDPWLVPILDSISVLSRRGCLFEAFYAYSWLRRRSPLPHPVLHPVSSLLACSTELRAELEGRQLHGHLISLGFQDSPPVVSRLVSFYAGCGAFDDAEAVAEGSVTGDSFNWNLLISAYVRAGFYWHALLAYEGMGRRGVSADNFTHSSVLKACGEMLEMGLGRGVHARVEKCSLERDLFVQNSLVSLYAKCGELATAEKLFVEMPDRDIVSWNALMAGYVANGMWEDAYKFLERMRVQGMELNTVTWNTIIRGNLQMSNYVGALQLVSQMKKNGSVLDSVTVAVGLIACSLSKAEELLNRMPIEPTAGMWASLVWGCQVHRNAEIGMRAAAKLLEMKTASLWNYLLVANVYASAGCWAEVFEPIGFQRHTVCFVVLLRVCAKLHLCFLLLR
ncbi:hypothetical protein Taro_018454 [Colocasia esculenta]|uniref:Pentatricopeptide repeat-containing protein n=1 Tax=Colocasia esculenta TaxID=4460 RepID=A0A843V2H1_COLES|nr:hypothetical protein [Colocasia esculenta]